jgi:soluble lytic murein transglycosylase-like protein
MADWTETDLSTQLNSAISSGWLPYFANAAQQNGFDTEFLLAIASRETNMRNIKGDFHDGAYHGFGIMQVDIGTDPAFAAAWTPGNIEGSVQRGTAILAGKRDSLAAKNITDLKAIAAAYNTGAANVIRSIQSGLDPDRTTTGHDYGSDVIARRTVFIKLRSTAAETNT